MLIHSTLPTSVELRSAIVRDPLIMAPNTLVKTAIAHMSAVRMHCPTLQTDEGLLDEVHLNARSSCVIVVEDNQVRGILTERDVVRLSAEQHSFDQLQIQEVMTRPVITLRESSLIDLFWVINLLQQYHIRHLPLVDDQDRLMGLLTHESLRQICRPVDLMRLRVVAEVMTSQVICSFPETSMLQIARLMAEHHVSSVVIVHPLRERAAPACAPESLLPGQPSALDQDLQQPLGIVTERDIIQFQALNLDLASCQAQMVMSTPIFSVKLEDSLWTVQQLMMQRRIRRLVVTGAQAELLGIVTQSSLLQALNPLELYKLTEVLEKKVLQLEAEKIDLLETRNLELERQVEARTLALQNQAERKRLVAQISSQIRASLKLQEILNTTVQQVRKVLNCDRVNIWQFGLNNEHGRTILVAEATDSPHSLLGECIQDDCFTPEQAEIYRQGKIRVVSDIYTEPMANCHRDMLIRLRTRAKILVPLLCGEQLWGWLNVTESQAARDWQPEEVELLQDLAVHLAIALQQATNHQQLQNELTERQQAEIWLRESQQRYLTLTTTAPVGIFRTDAAGKSTYANQYCCEILGLSAEATVGDQWQNALHPEDRDAVVAETIRTRQENCPFALEYRIVRPDGTVVWVLGRAMAELDAQGRVTGYVGTLTNISDRKQAELERAQATQALEQLNVELEQRVAQRTAELQEREAQLQDFFDHANDLIQIVSLETAQFEYVNRAWQKVLGYSPEELETLTIFEVLHPDSQQRFRAAIAQINTDKLSQLQQIELTFLSKTQQQVIVEGSLNCRFNGDRAVATRAIFRDITARKQAEHIIQQQIVQATLLREITQRIRQSLDLQTIFDTACQEIQQVLQADRVGIFKLDPASNFDQGEFVAESVVPGFSSVIAISVSDHCFGKNYVDLYAKGRFFVVDDIYTHDLTSCHSDILTQFEVRANLVVPLPCGNVLWGLLCIHQCGTARHWQEAEIDLIQQIANQLAIAIQQANLYEQIQAELLERQQAEAKLTESNYQLAISNQELARATRLKDEFLANMSHELRTPLNAILGMTEGLQDEVFGRINEQQRKTLQTVERSGTHLLELINDILDVAKIEAGQIELDLAEISTAHLCKSSLAFIKQQAHQKHIQLQVNLPPDLPSLVVDERRIRQVLINLLSNAVKFTPEGGCITLEATPLPPPASSTPATNHNFLRIAVVDTGIGIAPEYMAKLFQPFIQIDSALNRQYQGTGLGLALVKRIVELHGGQVELTSQLGVGSCFALTLPIGQQAHRAPRRVPAKSGPDQLGPDQPLAEGAAPEAPATTLEHGLAGNPPPDLATGPTERILLVEDNEVNISTISSYLGAKGYHLLLAKNGKDAIAIAKTEQPDLILMDIQMPGMDGLEATQQIRLDPALKSVPIIALTALAMPGDREQCLASGANEYLTKPVKLKQLATMIQQLLDDRSF